ncbi:MAG: MBOAT family protein [Fibrobacterota bacterium]|nr:MAG: MBOAT family protein [Fibrobacterota bacterium]
MNFQQLLSVVSPDGFPLVFPSGLFLWAFALFALLHVLVREQPAVRRWLFIGFSLWFYWRSSGAFVGLLVATTIVDYWLARAIDVTPSRAVKRLCLFLSLGSNLGVLGWFKYANFALGTWSGLSGRAFEPLDIVLPVGISFYTFQSLSYTMDVYRGEISALKRYRDFLFFASFFPQLVAGPIVRAKHFLPQMESDLRPSSAERSQAVRLIIGGLLKKIVVADFIAVNFVDRIFDAPLLHTGSECLLAAYGYAIQIYCDFSGYSDMAIGIALLLGFRLPINFDRPYAATSLTDFWRRWHISLSSWLRDYLYIALGGNRKGSVRTYVNLALTMLLGGLWHGASWKFVLWGGVHGVWLALEKWLGIPKRVAGSRWKSLLSWLVTFHLVVALWVPFRAKTLQIALDLFGQILAGVDFALLRQVVTAFPTVFLAMLAGYAVHLAPHSMDQWFERRLGSVGWVGRALALALAAWVVVQVRTAGIQPFIYFQF